MAIVLPDLPGTVRRKIKVTPEYLAYWKRIDEQAAATGEWFSRMKAEFPGSDGNRRSGSLIRLDARKTYVERVHRPSFVQQRRFSRVQEERSVWATAEINQASSVGRMQRIAECGDGAMVLRSKSTGEYRIQGRTCGSRLCPVCGLRRMLETQNRMTSAMPAWKAHEWKFITLTLRSSRQPLKDQLDHLVASFRRLRQRIAWRQHVQYGWAVIEITYNPTRRMWHPHLHVVSRAKFWLNSHLSDEWKAASRGSFVADIREIPRASARIKYVTKYLGKGPDLTKAENPRALAEEYVRAVKSRRMLIKVGNPPAMPDREQIPESEFDPDDWEVVCTVDALLEGAIGGRTESMALMERLFPGISEDVIRSVGGREAKPP